MSKYRIYDLARENNVSNKEVLDILAKNNFKGVKSHASTVGDAEKTALLKTLANRNKAQANESGSRLNMKPAHENNERKNNEPSHRPVQNNERMNQENNRANNSNKNKTTEMNNSQSRPSNHQSAARTNNGQSAARPNNGQSANHTAGTNRPNGGQGTNRPYNSQGANRPNNNQGANRPNNQGGQNRPNNGQGAARPNNGQGANHTAGTNRPNGGQGGNRPYNSQGANRPNNNQGGQNRPNNGQGANRPNNGQGGNRPSGGQGGNRPYNSQGANRPNNNQGGQNRPNNTQGNNRPSGTQGGNRPSGTQRANRPNGQGGQNNNYRGGNNNRGSSNFNNLRKQGPGARKPGGRNKRNQGADKPVVKVEREHPTLIQLGESITVKELATKMGYDVADIIKKLMMLGIMATINQELDFDTATLIAGEFDITVEELPPEQDPTEIPEIEDDPKTLQLRPPVVTVMGHVDHGKTSLLDVIRKTHVTSREAGGITQHIGAYQAICQKKKIVFLDTPGHEAFTAMRARGAQITDIAILVVAADDGVMPQTIEAINHAKSANVPIIVAINKIDREGANPDHVKQQLSEYGLISEEWGGETIMVPVSAKKQLGIDELLEMVLLVAEVQELKANPNRDAEGVIIEAQLDKGRGPVATVLVQKGTLRVGDSIIAGTAFGKVRAMINDRGEKVKKAGPSMPVEVLGLSDVPEAGDVLNAVDEKVARSVAEKRVAKKRSDDMAPTQKVTLDSLFDQIKDGEIKDLNILIKADVQGSVEAIKSSLLALNDKSDEVRVSIIHSGVGAVNESDVMLASASQAFVIAFNVRPDANARKIAESEKVDVRTYQIIYEAINDVKAAMTGMLAPQYKEVIQGHVEIRQVMSFSKALVAGSYVLDGKVTRNAKLRLMRDDVVVHEGEIESLRRFKDDVKEVAAGYECGITLADYRDIKEGDIMEIYTMEEIKPTMD